MPVKTIGSLCADCQSAEATLDIRKRRLCPDCFIRYVQSKVLKRMESYRFRNLQNNRKRRLLLPVSGGVSSLTLLQILDAQLRKQLASRNRTAYDLIIVRIVASKDASESSLSWSQALKQRFSIDMPHPGLQLSDVFQLDPTVTSDLTQFGLRIEEDKSPDEKMHHIMSSAISVTATTELQELLLIRLMVAFAKQQECEAILWGHSDTRLAAKALAGVAKGRGGALPFDICDGMTPWGLYFNFPLRDLFRSELDTYTCMLPEPFASLIEDSSASRRTASIRHTSIDDLLADYITSQGEKYPSIMANVVRTVGKLQPAQIGEMASSCAMCGRPNPDTAGNDLSDVQLCYACTRTKQDISNNNS